MYCAYAEVDPVSKCVLPGIFNLISRLHMRTLIANTQWGELSESEVGEKIKDEFIGDFKDFYEFLRSKQTIDSASIQLVTSYSVRHNLFLCSD